MSVSKQLSFESPHAAHRLQFDVDARSEWEPGDGDRCAGWVLALQLPRVHGVHRCEVVHVYEEAVHLDDLAPTAASRLEDEAEVVEDARGLLGPVVLCGDAE